MPEYALPDLRISNEVADRHEKPLYLDEGFLIVPLTEFFLELLALVDQELAVVRNADAPALQRPRRRSLEVDARDREAAAVTWAFELLSALQPVGSAAEMRAGRAQRINLAVVANDPRPLRLEPFHD